MSSTEPAEGPLGPIAHGFHDKSGSCDSETTIVILRGAADAPLVGYLSNRTGLGLSQEFDIPNNLYMLPK